MLNFSSRIPASRGARSSTLTLVMLLTLVAAFVLMSVAQAAAVEISVGLRPYNDAWIAYMEQLIEEFEAENPDITVTHFHLTGSTGAWQDNLTVQMAAGTAPDVFEMWGTFSLNLASSGQLLDLNPYVERSMTAGEIADFSPGQWDASVLYWGENAGIRYGMPRYTNVQLQYYNADLFNESGLEAPNVLYERGEWTWDTLLESARAITRRDGFGETTQWGYRHRTNGARWTPWVWNGGGQIFDFPNNPTDFRLDRPESLLGLEFLRSMMHDSQVAPPDDSYPDLESGIMGVSDHFGSCCIADMDAQVAGRFEWDIVPVPVGPGGHNTIIYNDMWGIWSGTPNAEAAWKFVQFATSARGAEIMVAHTGQQPPTRSGLEAYIELMPDFDLHYAFESAAIGLPDPYSVATHPNEVRGYIENRLRDALFKNEPLNLVLDEIAPLVRALYE